LDTPVFTFKFLFFLIKIFLLSIYKSKYTFSPRSNEKVGQQCNIKLFCKCFQNGATLYTENKQENRLGKLNYSNKFGKARQYCKSSAIKLWAFKQPSKKIEYAQPCCVFFDVIWKDPTSYM